MKCCANCFGDRGLRKEISFRSEEIGTCEYCATAEEILIDARELADKFKTLIDVYEPDDYGKSLAQLFKEDWYLFTHKRMDDAHVQVLLADILDDGQIVRKSYVPSKQYESDRLVKWEKLRQELMHENRFFPDINSDFFTRLKDLLAQLELDADQAPMTWYRARIQTQDVAFGESQMLAPPAANASHGRANPAGIPYLYLGSEIVTAVSEIRPHTGDIACIANFTMPDDLVLIDLCNPRATVSPFVLGAGSDIGRILSDLTFLERLGAELTRPVRQQVAAFDYTPSQYLCEFIKKCGYDGVVYRSSVSDGINLALFKPEKARIGVIQQLEVSKVLVEVTQIPQSV